MWNHRVYIKSDLTQRVFTYKGRCGEMYLEIPSEPNPKSLLSLYTTMLRLLATAH